MYCSPDAALGHPGSLLHPSLLLPKRASTHWHKHHSPVGWQTVGRLGLPQALRVLRTCIENHQKALDLADPERQNVLNEPGSLRGVPRGLERKQQNLLSTPVLLWVEQTQHCSPALLGHQLRQLALQTWDKEQRQMCGYLLSVPQHSGAKCNVGTSGARQLCRNLINAQTLFPRRNNTLRVLNHITV